MSWKRILTEDDLSTGTVNGTGAAGRVAFWSGSGTISSDTALTWDETNNRLTVDGPAVLHEVVISEYSSSELGGAGRHGNGASIIDDLGSTVVSAGRLYSLSESGGTTTWLNSDANGTEAQASGLLGVATTSSSRDGMVLRGAVRLSSNSDFSSGSVGDKLYLSVNANKVTSTAPSGSGQYVRIVGYILDAANSIIFLDPSPDYIQLS